MARRSRREAEGHVAVTWRRTLVMAAHLPTQTGHSQGQSRGLSSWWLLGPAQRTIIGVLVCVQCSGIRPPRNEAFPRWTTALLPSGGGRECVTSTRRRGAGGRVVLLRSDDATVTSNSKFSVAACDSPLPSRSARPPRSKAALLPGVPAGRRGPLTAPAPTASTARAVSA